MRFKDKRAFSSKVKVTLDVFSYENNNRSSFILCHFKNCHHLKDHKPAVCFVEHRHNLSFPSQIGIVLIWAQFSDILANWHHVLGRLFNGKCLK
jgi:hypothetical protein